jgi:hypothetical protein
MPPNYDDHKRLMAFITGREWQRVTENAGWAPRFKMGAVEYNSTVWILGGVGDAGPLSDVWAWRRRQASASASTSTSSQSGATWVRITQSASWGPRHSFGAVILPRSDALGAKGGLNETTLFVIGGVSDKDTIPAATVVEQPSSDGTDMQSSNGTQAEGRKPSKAAMQGVWSSQDGATWVNITQHTGAAACKGFAAISHLTPYVPHTISMSSSRAHTHILTHTSIARAHTHTSIAHTHTFTLTHTSIEMQGYWFNP